MEDFRGFAKGLYAFLAELKTHNNRAWFDENRARYEQYAKNPGMAFINAMRPRLEGISPSYQAIAKGNGGSMFRIYRDTRFSKNKAPYKTNIGFQFRHIAGKDAHAPGFYVHLESGENMAGGGIWMPPTPVLNRIREAVVRKADEWSAVRGYLDSSDTVEYFEGESLKRPPRGFDADHPHIEDLKRKTFFAGRRLTDAEVTSDDFIDLVEETFHDLVPMMRFINDALGLSF